MTKAEINNLLTKYKLKNNIKEYSQINCGIEPKNYESAGISLRILELALNIFGNLYQTPEDCLSDLPRLLSLKSQIEEEMLFENAVGRYFVENYKQTFEEYIIFSVQKYLDEQGSSNDSEWAANKINQMKRLSRRNSKSVQHEKLSTVIKFVQLNEPVLLTGPAGTGKNVICSQIAEMLKLSFYFSNAVTQEFKITGFTDANGIYHESQFYKAFSQGGLFLLDELDSSIPEVLVILNAAISNKYFDFPAPIGKVMAHPDFRVIAAANTFGTGADYSYSGRYQLDAASLDRFALVRIDYSETIEESITNDMNLLYFIRDFRSACYKAGINHTVSYRALKRLSMIAETGDRINADLIQSCLTKNLSLDDLKTIQSEMNLRVNSSRWTRALNRLIKEFEEHE